MKRCDSGPAGFESEPQGAKSCPEQSLVSVRGAVTQVYLQLHCAVPSWGLRPLRPRRQAGLSPLVCVASHTCPTQSWVRRGKGCPARRWSGGRATRFAVSTCGRVGHQVRGSLCLCLAGPRVWAARQWRSTLVCGTGMGLRSRC